ncbi:hypothetical protein [Salinigranum halophilum]|uniref:hypothetical protein n=1 Tax=Salinigranum halophilum TaxID=2565931 RepID=UPI00115F2FCE|nr:hypothetical protein [Salinigranum halophilum]
MTSDMSAPIESIDGVPTDSIIVISDPATSGGDRGNMGWLRSLPYLVRQGVTTYTFNPAWLRYGSDETFDEVLEEQPGEGGYTYRAIDDFSFQYQLIETDTPVSTITAPHICQYTSQEGEHKGEVSTTHKLLRAYDAGQLDELVLVVDKSGFRLSKQETDKPLIEALDVHELSYRGVASYYLKHELPVRYLGLDETLNIWLHEAAIEYASVMESEPNRIADLFEFDVLQPGIRTWGFLEFLANKTTEEQTDHVQATIRPWVERDITKIRDHILNALQRFEFDAEQVRAFRNSR